MTTEENLMADEIKYEYFRVVRMPREPGRKTDVYEVVSREETFLGTLQWYGPWRQYCFFPEYDTVWSAGCLRDVQAFLDGLAEERKKGERDG